MSDDDRAQLIAQLNDLRKKLDDANANLARTTTELNAQITDLSAKLATSDAAKRKAEGVAADAVAAQQPLIDRATKAEAALASATQAYSVKGEELTSALAKEHSARLMVEQQVAALSASLDAAQASVLAAEKEVEKAKSGEASWITKLTAALAPLQRAHEKLSDKEALEIATMIRDKRGVQPENLDNLVAYLTAIVGP